jgi:hypothetical protein
MAVTWQVSNMFPQCEHWNAHVRPIAPSSRSQWGHQRDITSEAKCFPGVSRITHVRPMASIMEATRKRPSDPLGRSGRELLSASFGSRQFIDGTTTDRRRGPSEIMMTIKPSEGLDPPWPTAESQMLGKGRGER